MKVGKIIAPLMAAVMIITLFGACGSTEQPEESKAAQTVDFAEPSQAVEESTPSEQPTEAASSEPIEAEQAEYVYAWPEEPVTITLFKSVHPALIDFMDSGMTMDTWSVWKWVSENLNVKIDMHYCSMNDQQANYSLMFAGGDYDDVIYSAVACYPTGAAGLIEEGIAIDHLELVQEYCPNMYACMESEGIDKYMTEDKLAGFFTINEYYQYPEQSICIRQDWLDDCGLDMPQTYDQLHDTLEVFKTQLGADAALLLNDSAVMAVNNLNAGYGVGALYSTRQNNGSGAYYANDGVVKFGPAEEGFKSYLQMLTDWYAEGLIYKDFYQPLTAFETVDPTVANGSTGVFLDSVEDFYIIANTVDDGKCRIAAMPNPTVNEDDTYYIGHTSSTTTDAVWSISTACDEEKQKYVAMLVNYFFDGAEGTELANYGIEGESFEYNDEGKPVFTELMTNNPNGYQTMMCYTLYTLEAQDPILYDCHRAYSGYTEDQWNAFDVWLEDYEDRDNYYGTLRAEEESDYSLLYADIATYVQEYVASVITGTHDLNSTWDSYVDTLKNTLQLDKCIEFRQHAYDDYFGK